MIRTAFRAITALIGLVAGAALAYAAVRWLLEQEMTREALGDTEPPELPPVTELAERAQARIRLAVEEGKRAAEAARTELEAELQPPV